MQTVSIGLYLSSDLEFTRRHELDIPYDGIENLNAVNKQTDNRLYLHV